MNKWVKLKNFKELARLGYEMSFSGDGSNMIIGKPGQARLGISTDRGPRMVVNCDTLHENALKICPDAFEEVKPL